MKFVKVFGFSTEGAPIFIGDASYAQHWNGTDFDDGDIVIEYWCADMDRLPKKFLKEEKINPRSIGRKKKFKTAAEADAFQKEILSHLQNIYPKAAKPPQYPDYPTWYEGNYMDDKAVFGIEKKFTSAYDKMLKKLKGDVDKIMFEKKHKAEALFFEAEGGGQVVVAQDSQANIFTVSKITSVAARYEDVELLSALNKISPNQLKKKNQIEFTDKLAIFESGKKGTEVAQNSILTIAPGKYSFSVIHNAKASGFSYNALWFVRGA